MKKTKRTQGRQGAVGSAAVDAEPGVLRVASLSELEAVVNEPVAVLVKFNGRQIEVPVRRLTPGQSARLEEIVNREPMPMRENPETGKSEVALDDAEYNKRSAKRLREARALACWWGCPLFKEAWLKANPAAHPEAEPPVEVIVEFVEGRLTEIFLNAIDEVARSFDAEVMGRLGF